MLCRVCGNSQHNKTHIVKEMMFGFGDEFTYFECSSCGCLQIANLPADMAKYYPSDYYSYQPAPPESPIRRLIRIRRDRHELFGTGTFGRLVSLRYPNSALAALRASKAQRKARVLDVGCGSGVLLGSLRDLGFTKLLGVDPYIEGDTAAGPIRIIKKTILDLPDSEKFDFVFFNHSFEHIWAQRETLAKVDRLLTTDGVCIVRMPIKTDTMWSLYGVHWVQIDAPRHFCVHTVGSFSLLSLQAGLVVRRVGFDSAEFAFWGSEQYRRNIPLTAKESYGVNPGISIFTPSQIRDFRRKARRLNLIGEGDQATFSLGVQR